MKDLNKTRETINEIDKKMAELFEKRMNAVNDVIDYKIEKNMPIFDEKREQEVFSKNLEQIKNFEYQNYYIDFIKSVMDISKKYQQNRINQLSSNIIIKRGIIKNAKEYLDLNRNVLIVTDNNIPKEYVEIIKKQCKNAVIYVITPGEESKSLESFSNILKLMLTNNFQRGDVVLAIGGGVVGDLAGFCASTYMRGIGFYNIPTSLLSQVDSSIGGKTAVNLENVKNIVGSFYQPDMVLIDSDLLKSLPKREYNSAMAEVIKMAVTLDKDFFEYLEICDFTKDIDNIIKKSIENKIKIVSQDEKEKGIRKVLNFGHTIGHGIEVSTTLNHGESVGVGMLFVTFGEVRNRIEKLLLKAEIPTKIDFDINKVIDAMKHDKKSENDKISVVFCEEIGKYNIKKLTIKEIESIILEVK